MILEGAHFSGDVAGSLKDHCPFSNLFLPFHHEWGHAGWQLYVLRVQAKLHLGHLCHTKLWSSVTAYNMIKAHSIMMRTQQETAWGGRKLCIRRTSVRWRDTLRNLASGRISSAYDGRSPPQRAESQTSPEMWLAELAPAQTQHIDD